MIELDRTQFIQIRGARSHNLKDVDLDLPRGSLVFVTGPSGSGKTSLAFDTLCREGHRRYVETFSSYARQFLTQLAPPDVHRISGLSPAIGLAQRARSASARSTVGTITEIYDLLRLLFARSGEVPPDFGARAHRSLFSFNSAAGACPMCQGLGVHDRLDPALLIADPSRTLRQGALTISLPNGYVMYSQVTLDVLDRVCRAHDFHVDIPWQELTDQQRAVVLYGSDRIRIPYGKHPLESRLRWTGITPRPRQEGVYKGIIPVMDQILRRSRNRNILRYVRSLPCEACNGSRLRPEALAVKFRGLSIAQLAALPIQDLCSKFEDSGFRRGGSHAAAGQIEVQEPIIASIVAGCRRLCALGVGYLSLDRDSTSLSGGEAQRVRLASFGCLGLRGILYVLDEPSAGLHVADQDSLAKMLQGLRDQGNTVVVVDHDARLVRCADWIVDIGPEAGVSGGEVLFNGPAASVFEPTGHGTSPALSRSATWAFFSGQRRMQTPERRRAGRGELRIHNACRNNLKDIDVSFLVGALNVVTGVSGAGKSSLMEELAERVAAQHVEGERIGRVVAVDGSPIGRTPRSNPATYTGLSDYARDLFAGLPEAKTRGLRKGAFSFNVPGGRCEVCEGAGVREIGMRFLGTVETPCEACGGKRFRDEVLEVRWRGRTIHDVLEATVDEAIALFGDQPAMLRILTVLRELGLGYLPLGHPATALSGGEAQRIKLASELAHPKTGASSLYLLDEPTIGLHPVDVELLLAAVQRLVDRGSTAVIVEHDLDVIRSADRVIDLGPGSGPNGGNIVVCGTPTEVTACTQSATGRALGQSTPEAARTSLPLPKAAERQDSIQCKGVRTHNLKGIDVEFPVGRLSVVTGVSGSGKSSLAFDTLFAEGQARFTDAFSSWGRRYLPKRYGADFDEIRNLTPTIGIRQAEPSRNPRSTVGTMTEIDDLLRLLLSRFGQPMLGLRASAFSPNSEQGACPDCKGLGTLRTCSPQRLVTHPERPLFDGALAGHKTGRFYGDPHGQHAAILHTVGVGLGIDYTKPWNELDDDARMIAMAGTGERLWDVHWKFRRQKREGVHQMQAPWRGLARYVEEEYERKHDDHRGESLEPLMQDTQCPTCAGTRIREPARSVSFAGMTFGAMQTMSCSTLLDRLRSVDDAPSSADIGSAAAVAAKQLGGAITRGLKQLLDAGLGYLSLGRSSATLSTGEAQRVRLASTMDTGLTGITLVLDEPTRGLHSRDTQRLIGLLQNLTSGGNSVVVVEHDLDVIRAADYVIDLGPRGGANGGRVVVQGALSDVLACADSRTGLHMREVAHTEFRAPRPLRAGIEVRGACANNLRALDVLIPAGGLVAVTGVSGSGKSSLVFDVIAASWRADEQPFPVFCNSIVFKEPFAQLICGEALSASGAAASVVATRIGVFDAIRERFAQTDYAQARSWNKAHFALSSRGGRCEACQGAGRIRVGLDFLPDASTICDECEGARYDRETLACLWQGWSMADVLGWTADEAVGRMDDRSLHALHDIGLGYVPLGQPVGTLSRGERQRLGLAIALNERRKRGPKLLLLDEPTAGLHADDVARLIRVLHEIVEIGDSVIVVDHDLGLISRADHVIDLGPEGGDGGGELIAQGTPAEVARDSRSATGRALRAECRANGTIVEVSQK